MIDLREHLTSEQFADFALYRAEWAEHWKNGTHRWLRMARAHKESANLDQVRHALLNRVSDTETAPEAIARVIGEDAFKRANVEHCVPHIKPYDLDAPAGVEHPSPEFIWELMRGGIHPPIDAEHDVKLLLISQSGKSEVVRQIDAPDWRAHNGPVAHEIVVDYRRIHNETQGSLTYEEAIEYCIMKCIPHRVWGEKHNRPQFWIVERDAMPVTRTYRDAWKLNDEPQLIEAA